VCLNGNIRCWSKCSFLPSLSICHLYFWNSHIIWWSSQKTTLMDVIALRKRSGTISGKVLLNGFPQDAMTFRRCSGYVEQFDVQSPELTVRETILFSARLRLDPALVPNDEDVQNFVDSVMVGNTHGLVAWIFECSNLQLCHFFF